MVGTKHANSRPKLGAPKRNHMLSNMGGHHLAVLRCSIVKNPLHKIVAILITRNINQRDPGPVQTTFADSVQITTQKITTPNF